MEGNRNLWIIEGTRELLLDIIDGSVSPKYSAEKILSVEYVDPRNGKLAFIWVGSVNSLLPHIIIGEPEALDDLLSWAATYLKSVGPLTAQIRLLTPSSKHLLRDPISSTNRNFGALAKAFVGLIVSEVSFLSGRMVSSEDVTVAACQSTLSFAMIKAMLGNYTLAELNELPYIWMKSRVITDQKSSEKDLDDVTLAVSILLELSDESNSISSERARILRALQHGEDVPFSSLSYLGPFLMPASMQGFSRFTAEERVKIFDKISRDILFKPLPRGDQGFFIALLAVLCRPGAFEAVRLLQPYVEQVPSCILWFGLMQGLVPKNDSLSTGGGLGWRILRDLQIVDDIFSRPRCDISFRELQIYTRTKAGLRSIRSEVKSKLWIELLPGITASFKLSERGVEYHEQQTSLPFSKEVIAIQSEVLKKSLDEQDKQLVHLEKVLAEALYLLQKLKTGRISDERSIPKPRSKKKNKEY